MPTYKTFYIYFSDLNKNAQKRLLKFVGAKNPSEMNWGMGILPIAQLDIENNNEEI